MADTQNVAITLTATDNLSPTITSVLQQFQALQQHVTSAGSNMTQLATVIAQAQAQFRALQQSAATAGASVQQNVQAYGIAIESAQAQLTALAHAQQAHTETVTKSTQEVTKQAGETHKSAETHGIWGEALARTLEPLREHIGGVGQLSSAFQALAAPVGLARESLQQHGATLSSLVLLSGGVVASTLALGAALVGLAAKTAENRKEFGEMAERLGVSLPFLQALTASARIANVDIDSLGRGFTRFNANLAEAAKGAVQGGTAYSNLVTTLGLTREQLGHFDQALIAVAAQWNNLSAQDRARVGMQLFSLNVSQVNKLLQELYGEHLVKLHQRQDAYNEGALKAGVDLSKEYVERLANLTTKFTEFWQTIGVKAFIPAANSILDWLGRIPAMGLAIHEAVRQVGETVGVTPARVSQGAAVQAAPEGYRAAFTAAGQKYNIDPDLLARIAQTESGFDPRAVNARSGAAGLMQILPSTAQAYGANAATLTANPLTSIQLGAEILRDLIAEFRDYADATKLGTLAYRAGTVAIWEAVRKAEATGQIATATTIQPFVTPASRKYYQDIFGAGLTTSTAGSTSPEGTSVPAEGSAHRTGSAEHGAAPPGSGTLNLETTEALNHYRDVLKADAQALESQAIQTKAALLEQEQGKVVAEQYRLTQMQALKLRQTSEDVDRASLDALGGVPQQITIYKQRIAQFSGVLLDLTQQHAQIQARQALPQMEALLARIGAFTGRPEASAGEAARAQVVVRGTELETSISAALKQIRLMPELLTLAPDLQGKLEAALTVIPQTITVEGARQAALANEALHAQIVKIGADIGAAGLAPLDATLAGIRQKFTAAQEALSLIAKKGIGSEDTALIAQIQAALETRQQAAFDAAMSKATIDLQKHVTDLSLTISGAADEPRQRELLKIAQWGEDMRAEINKILGPGGLPVGSEALRPFLEDLLTKIPAAEERKKLESSDFYKTMLSISRSVEQTFSTLWENILTGGVTSFRNLGLQVAQALQHTFAQISSQLMNAILNGLTGTTAKEGGWAGALAGVLGKLATTAIGGFLGGSTASTSTAESPGLEAMFASGGIAPHGFTSILSMQGGGVVSRPSFSTLAEMGQPEAVVPLASGNIPVHITGQGQQAQQPIVIQVQNSISYAGSWDPRMLKTSSAEIIHTVAKDISSDGILRKIVIQKGQS